MKYVLETMEFQFQIGPWGVFAIFVVIDLQINVYFFGSTSFSLTCCSFQLEINFT